mgnify:CR=1 FL=1
MELNSELNGMVWSGLEWNRTTLNGMEWNDMGWDGMEQSGVEKMVWIGIISNMKIGIKCNRMYWME